jgi:hypothetical protein
MVEYVFVALVVGFMLGVGVFSKMVEYIFIAFAVGLMLGVLAKW